MTIVCATDFSPSSQRAAQIAAGLARRFGDSLLLLHVVEPNLAAYPDAAGEMSMWQLEMEEIADAQMDAATLPLRQSEVPIESRVVVGSPSAVILRTASDQQARFIVMGTRGRKGPSRLFHRSVAARVVRSASCPVLVARESQANAEQSTRWMGNQRLHLAIGIDGTPAAETALAWTASLAPALQREVTVVRLSWPPQDAVRYGLDEPWLGDQPHPEVYDALQADLSRQLEAFPRLNVNHIRFRIAHVDAAQVLADEAQRMGADAIVVGVPRGAVESWNAIVPKAVLQTTSLPVICLPDAAAPKARDIPRVRSVLIATDLTDLSNRAILPAYALLRSSGGRVDLCHVHERADHEREPRPSLGETQRALLESQLRGLVPPDAEARGISTNVSVLEAPVAAEAILAASRRLDVDIVALASHGRSGVKRALLGSVAEQVARHCTRPVLIVHAGGG